MLKKISVKCIDGSRFDIECQNNEYLLEESLHSKFIVFNAKNGRIAFNIRNIVSIKETEIEDG